VPTRADLPADRADLVGDDGALVVWSKTDRLAMHDSGGARQTSTVQSELVRYMAQTLRKFLDGGQWPRTLLANRFTSSGSELI
jgi:hypothetical protein